MGWGIALLTGLALGAAAGREAWKWQINGDRARTVCPACGTQAEHNEGLACTCGGAFVKASDMRWEDEPETSDE